MDSKTLEKKFIDSGLIKITQIEIKQKNKVSTYISEKQVKEKLKDKYKR